MEKILFTIVILYFAAHSHGLVLRRGFQDVMNLYKVDPTEGFEKQPDLDFMKKSEEKPDVVYVLLVPKDSSYFETLLDNDEYHKYVIIKSKLVDIDSHLLIHRVDKTKQMVRWLHLYCEMHPDCDSSKLNEELQKVRPYLNL